MAAVQGDFLQALAGSRRQAAPAGPSSIPESLVVRRDSSAGRLRIDLSLACASTSLGVAQTLLTAFVEASSAAQRAWNGQMEITLPAAPASSGGAEQAAAAGAAPQPLIVQLTATSSDPEAEAAVEEAARLFEAYFQFHLKAAKSDLHCRMRQRLGALRQQLLLTRVDG